MTLTEVTTDFTSGVALGSCLSPGAHSSELGCFLGNPGVLCPTPLAGPLPGCNALDHCTCLGGAWWGGSPRSIQRAAAILSDIITNNSNEEALLFLSRVWGADDELVSLGMLSVCGWKMGRALLILFARQAWPQFPCFPAHLSLL